MRSLRWWKLIVMCAAAVLATGCGSSGSSPDQVSGVRGTLAIPQDLDHPYQVFVDEDADPANGFVKIDEGNCDCGTEVSYVIADITPGTYYVYGIIRNTDPATQNSPPVAGDYVGYFGGTGTDPPAAANVQVLDKEVKTIDFTLTTLL